MPWLSPGGWKFAGKISAEQVHTPNKDAPIIGLIVKGPTALFVEGANPGSEGAVALVNRYRAGNNRSLETKLTALNLRPVARPSPLPRRAIAWGYVFVVLTEGDEQRLEPGPFDVELSAIVAEIEGEQKRA